MLIIIFVVQSKHRECRYVWLELIELPPYRYKSKKVVYKKFKPIDRQFSPKAGLDILAITNKPEKWTHLGPFG